MRISDWSSDVCSSDLLSGHQFVRARIVSKDEAGMQSAGMAAAVGAALTLLLVSCIYSLSLAVAVRRQYLAWQAAWAATMLLWGTLWSQAHLGLLPATAGTITAQAGRSEEHTSELQSLMSISYAVLCLKKKNTQYKY